MKNTRNTFSKTISSMIIVFAIICTSNLNAQIPGGGPGGGGLGGAPALPPTDTVDHNKGVPLDGGLAILIIGAAAFGIKKLRDNNKK
ncbi:MAG: hypothetical protein ABJM36_14745 [Algibacter sp.]|uniref:PID-CTERM protein-sorting domain-containing protein n=1 Tax=Algibacter sp. TaxID=1872428 RepID=UPI003299330B